MNGAARLFVTHGLHAGASIALPDDRDVSIGSGSNAELILVDTGIAPLHATVRVRGGRLLLRAASEGIVVYARALSNGKTTVLRHGAIFHLAETALMFSNGAQLTDRDTLRAERAWLRAHAPLRWLRKQCARISRVGWAAIAVFSLAMAALYNADLFLTVAPPSARSALDRPAFRNVRMRVDEASHTRVYEGYVQSSADLGALSVATRAQGSAVSVRVAVIDNMQDQLSDFLDRYYRGAQLQSGEPGTFIATLPGVDAYLQPESWDYTRVGRLAQAQVDGLKALRFAGHEDVGGPVRIPMEAVGLNLVSSPHAAWLADRQGKRYFVGARVEIGRIDRIDGCKAIVTRDDGSVYELSARRTDTRTGC